MQATSARKLILAIVLGLMASVQARSEERSSTEDLDALTTIETQSYDHSDVTLRWWQNTGIAATTPIYTIANSATFNTPSTMIETEVLGILNMKGLDRYFPTEKERTALADSIATLARNEAGFGISMTSSQGKIAVKSAVTETIQLILGRVFKQEKLSRPGSTEAWTSKLLGSFNQCHKAADSVVEANRCVAILKPDMMANIGLAGVYEASRKQFKGQETRIAGEYKKCVSSNISPENIIKCGESKIQDAAVEFARSSLVENQRKHLPGSKADVQARVIPAFETCIRAAKTQDAIQTCSDSLAISSAKEFVAEKAAGNPAFQSAFTSPALRQEKTQTAVKKMEQCLQQAQSENRRDSNGILETAACAQNVTEFMVGSALTAELESNLGNSIPSKAKSDLQERLMKDFGKCLAADKTEGALIACTEGMAEGHKGLLAKAIYEVTLISSRKEMQKHLKSDQIPKEILESEALFKKCIQTNPKSYECAKAHVNQVASVIALTKLTRSFNELMGTDGVKKESARIAEIKKIFKDCLAQIPAGKEMKTALARCTAQLSENGTKLAQAYARKALAQKGDDAQVRQIKSRLVDKFPELARVTEDDRALNVDKPSPTTRQGLLTPSVRSINDFIAYDPKGAGKAIDTLITEANREHSSNTARKETVVAKLANQGSVDQLIKSMVYSELKASIAKIPANIRPSNSSLQQLLDRKNFDQVFTPQVLAKLRAQVVKDLIYPVFIKGVRADSAELRGAHSALKAQIAEALLASPRFGKVLASGLVQGQLNQQDGLTQFFANLFYGDRALDWNRVRNSRQGQSAERFILQNLVLPRMTGRPLSAVEQQRRTEIAKEYVTAAVTGPETVLRAPGSRR